MRSPCWSSQPSALGPETLTALTAGTGVAAQRGALSKNAWALNLTHSVAPGGIKGLRLSTPRCSLQRGNTDSWKSAPHPRLSWRTPVTWGRSGASPASDSATSYLWLASHFSN